MADPLCKICNCHDSPCRLSLWSLHIVLLRCRSSRSFCSEAERIVRWRRYRRRFSRFHLWIRLVRNCSRKFYSGGKTNLHSSDRPNFRLLIYKSDTRSDISRKSPPQDKTRPHSSDNSMKAAQSKIRKSCCSFYNNCPEAPPPDLSCCYSVGLQRYIPQSHSKARWRNFQMNHRDTFLRKTLIMDGSNN